MFDTKNFNDSLVEGNIGEFVVWNFFTKLQGIRQVVDVRADKRFQEYDVDFLMEQNDRQYVWVEVKTDFYSDSTGNIVYETETLGKKGCFAKTKADYVAYYVAHSGCIYVINVSAIRKYIESHNPKEYTLCNKNKGYLLPIEELGKYGVFEKIYYAERLELYGRVD